MYVVVWCHMLIITTLESTASYDSEQAAHTLAIDGIFVLLQLVDSILQFRSEGFSGFRSDAWSVTLLMVRLILFVDCIHYATRFPSNVPRVGRPFRPLAMMIRVTSVRVALTMFFKTLPKFTDFCILLISYLVSFSAIGTVLLHDFRDYEAGIYGFTGIVEGVKSTFALLTAENYPDIMIPAFEESWVYSVYFLFFLIFGQVFFVPGLIGKFHKCLNCF